MAADVTVTGVGVDPAGRPWAALRVTGDRDGQRHLAWPAMSAPSWSDRSGTAGCSPGYTGPDMPDPAGFYMPATVGVFRTTSRFDGFQDSYLVATAFRTVVLNGLDAANDGTGFGVYADASLGVVSVLSPDAAPIRFGGAGTPGCR